MRVLLVGSGGREHALAWALTRSAALSELHAAPGNPGIAALGECHPVGAADAAGVVHLARALAPDLVVVGPETPLVAGLADALRERGIAVFGPSRAAARIEGSKGFAKDVLRAAGVPTARELREPRAPCVVKFDGLAAGKGVFVCRSERELVRALPAVSALGGPLLIEELLEGEEVSVFAVCDGMEALPLAPARDFKRSHDGDRGPNTGGMGSYSPVPELADGEVDEVVETVHRPVLRELASRGCRFSGLLYAGLMLTDDGPRVLEFNCRFGDPETQSIVPRLAGDLLAALAAAARGDLSGTRLAASGAAVTVVLAAERYPEGSDTGTLIEGIAAAEEAALAFHAGTALQDGAIVTNGGRILDVTGVAETIEAARSRAYVAAARISCPALRYRTDIAAEVAPVRT